MARFRGKTGAPKCKIRSAATAFDKTIFREICFERIDCSVPIRRRLLHRAAGGGFTELVATNRNRTALMLRPSRRGRRELRGEKICRLCALCDHRLPIPSAKRVENSSV